VSVAQILEQLAENAGRRQLNRGALYGNLVAGASQVPARAMADREQQRIRQLQEARQAEQIGFARNADARAQADQVAQDAARKATLEHQAAVRAGLAASMGPEGDPSTFDARAAFAAVSQLGKPEAITDVIAAHRALQAKPVILKEGERGFNPDTNTPIPGMSVPEKKPDYTVNGVRFSGETNQPYGPATPPQAPPVAPPKAGDLADYLSRKARELGKPVADLSSAETAKFTKEHTDATQKTPILGGMNALYADIDPKAIAAQIRVAQHPPDISQYGRPAAAAIASELAKKGPNGEPPFDLSRAQREWKAQLRLNATMNGAQQVRLDESIRSGLAMYDKVDELAKQWDGLGIGPLSRINLAAARDGLKGPAAASLANQLTGQIGQLTSDIATIEQGGLTPTNEARAVAEKSMQDWWGKGTILDMTAQGRYNMQIRHAARNTQEPMVPGNGIDRRPAEPATPPPATPPPPAGAAPQKGDTKPLVGPGYPPDALQQFNGTQWIRIK